MATQVEDFADDMEVEHTATEDDAAGMEGSGDGSGSFHGGEGDDNGTGAALFQPESGDDEADLVSFGESNPLRVEDESEGVRNLREALKQERRARKEAEAKLAPAAVDIGLKPVMDDYWDDPEKYDSDLLAWNERKRKADEGVIKQRELAEKVEREIADAVTSYDTQRASLRVPNFDGAHDRVSERLTDRGMEILRIAGGDRAAPLAYALGNSPERLEALGKYDLSKITDVLKLAADIGRMAGETKVERRKPSTQPESVQRGGGAPPRGDQRRAALEREADSTGDRSKLIAYDYKNRK